MHKMATTALVAILNFLLCLVVTHSIVNPNQQSSNTVIYVRKPNEIGPTAWNAGVKCLDTFSTLYFQRKERFTRSYNIMLTSASNMSTPAAQIQDGFLRLVNEAISEVPVQREIFQLRVVSDANAYVVYRIKYGELLLTDFYVIVIDKLSRLHRLMRDFVSRTRSWNPGAKFLVLFHHIDKREQELTITHAIFDELLDEYFINRVGILYAINMTTYTFWTNDYYNNVKCRHTSLRRIGECRNGEAYPSLATVNRSMIAYFRSINLENCTFNMCTSISAPFVERDCVAGIELRIIGIIKNRLKFLINQTCEEDSRGVLDEFGNWTGLLARLNERYCDFILGGFYPDNDVTDSFWVSDCYLSDSHTWFVKLAAPRPAWRALYSIFQIETWGCFMLVLIITWIFWYFFANILHEPLAQRDFSLAVINSIGLTIGAAVYERPNYNASRVFYIALTLYGLNAVTIYTSNLISVFTNPGFQHQIHNIHEVVAAGIPFGGLEENRDWFENDADMWIFKNYNISHEYDPNTVNLMAVKNGERVILSSRMYILQNNISDDIYAFKSNVFSSPLQIIMKPGFPFIYDINWKIRQMRDAGFFTKIDNDFQFNNTILNRIVKMRPVFQDSAIVLTTENLQGPFVILMLGVSCSTFFFMCELYVFWCLAPCVKRKFDWELGAAKVRNVHSGPHMIGLRRTPTKVKNKQRVMKIKPSNNKMIAKKRENAKNNKKSPKKENDILEHNINVWQNVRFTPVKRRIIILKDEP